MMDVWTLGDDDPSLDQGEDHEGVHRSLDVVGRVLLRLNKGKILVISAESCDMHCKKSKVLYGSGK
jgi:hypothetical protein